jgi:glycogen(starch) synthase
MDQLLEARPRVLRLCSVFEPPTELPSPRFDPIGGMQNHVGELSRRLDARGVAQKIITSRPPPAPARQTLGRHSEIYRVGLPISKPRQLYCVPAFLLARRLAGEVDVIHAHQGEDLAVLMIAIAAAQQHHISLVVTIHCSLRHTLAVVDVRSAVLATLGATIEKVATLRADAIIAITHRLHRCLLHDGVDPLSLYTIFPGINRDLFRGPFHDELGGIRRPRILFVGRMTPQKGVHTLMAAFQLLGNPAAQLVFVGDGSERGRLERRAQELMLDHRVHFLGFVAHDRIPGVLAGADVLVLPSLYEELGSILLESMQLGLPVVASRTGGTPDVISDGETGLLVPPGDASALASALDKILADARLRTWLGNNARHRGKEYDWEVVAHRVLGVYNDVLARQ